MKKFVGIDISYKEFDVGIPQDCKRKFSYSKHNNTEEGITESFSILPPDCHVILEATGNYSLLMTKRLIEAGYTVSVINPKASQLFRKLSGQIWKDDQSDARLLSLYGQKMQPAPFELPARSVYELKQKRALLRQYKKQKQAMSNFLHSLSVHPFKDESVEKSCQKQIEFLDQQIKEMETNISKIVREEYGEMAKLLRSIKGIGPKTSWALIESTGGFQAFDSHKQFSKFVGIAPTYVQSGTSVKMASRINRSGDPDLRALLYVCTWSAIQYNSACKDIYERLIEKGKPSKVALVAVMNKLIRQAFAVVQKGEPYQDDFEQKLKQKQRKALPEPAKET